MLVVERNGQIRREFVEDSSGNLILRPTRSRTSISALLYSFFQEVFLPQGFPESVSSDYVTYQIWDTVQAFCSSITGALAMKAVLGGYGVGDESKTVLAAAITWLLKDGTSMCGRICFAWWNGAQLDSDAKQWRLFADVLNDAAIFLELVSQYFPRGFFTPVVCVAGVGKAIVGVAGGATRAALTQHQAKCNNMADVSAKDGSQETMVNLAALLANLWLLPFVDDKHRLLWILFLVFTCLHIYSNFKAVSSVVMETLNLTRFFLIFSHFAETGAVFSPEVANRRESVWWRNHNPTGSEFSLHFATSVGKMARHRPSIDFRRLIKNFAGEKYVVSLSTSTRAIDVLLGEGCDSTTELKALFFAAHLRLHLDRRRTHSGYEPLTESESQLLQYLEEKKGEVEGIFADFQSKLLAVGWDLQRHHFDSKAYRFSVKTVDEFH